MPEAEHGRSSCCIQLHSASECHLKEKTEENLWKHDGKNGDVSSLPGNPEISKTVLESGP
jgi:hypothetical protein